MLITTLLLALGFSGEDIVDEFYENETCVFNKEKSKWKTKFDPEIYKSKNFSEEIIDAKTNKTVVKLNDKINFLQAKKLQNEGLKDILVSKEYLIGKFLHRPIKIGDEEFKIGTEINDTILEKVVQDNINLIEISKTNSINKGPYILQTLLNDKNTNKNDANTEIYNV